MEQDNKPTSLATQVVIDALSSDLKSFKEHMNELIKNKVSEKLDKKKVEWKHELITGKKEECDCEDECDCGEEGEDECDDDEDKEESSDGDEE